MARVVSFRWLEGYAVAEATPEGVRLRFSNLTLEFGLREVLVEGVFEGYREYTTPRGERKTIYIDFAFPARGVAEPRGAVYSGRADVPLGGYGLSYTSLEPSSAYITLYPPPGALYDYVTVSPDLAAIFTVGRRQVYMMREEGSTVRIILV
ncbi:hypothetical protein apy_05330 [Aeropyrum pernix]|uniref:Uncharacterized protein n=1 Tax=Aeropyrum pernix TaxID=56636 RepID=A0A401H8W2_AERPX|nr:hypothetical protein [Aeropyrum pernix]GBF08808.1 hypothetical protein apy_05330 [Aeropyrum pernix]